MSETSERYGRIADGFAARLAGVTADAWDSRSPCPDWTARQVAAHVIATHHRVLSRVLDASSEATGPDDDLWAAWVTARSRIESALADPAIAQKVSSGSFGEQSFEALAGTALCTDTLVHTWDLARATGQDERLDPDAVDKATEFLTPMDQAIRRPGGYGPRIEAAEGADAQTRFLNFCGRA